MEESGWVDVDVPSYFLCPISLQIMRDPVTLPTGITYDRDSIEKWIFSGAGKVGSAAACCPVTKQPVPQDTDLTPNHTLRRIIQAWCAANASHGVERFPTPRAPLDKAQVARLLEEARRPETRLAALRKLRSLAAESERNRRCAVAASAPELLVSVIKGCAAECSDEDDEPSTSGGDTTCQEAIATLHSLKVSTQGYCELIGRNADVVDALAAVLRRRSSYQCRAYATFLLKSLLEAASPSHMLALKEEVFRGLVNVVRDEISDKATKAALRLLAQACPWGQNRVKAAEAGAVSVLVEMLLDGPARPTCEMALVVLDQLCGCAEGRAALLGHAAGLAVVSKKIVRVSPLATERAVRVIASVGKYSATPAVLREMVQVGVVAKLCLLLQVEEEGESKAKERAMGVLKLHARTWKDSPCIPPQLLASFTTARPSRG